LKGTPKINRRALSATLWMMMALVYLAVCAPAARADYIVLQSGQRIHVTGYEYSGDSVHLTVMGGTMDLPAQSVLRIDAEDTFLPIKVRPLDVPFADLIVTSAQSHGVAPELVASVIAVESNFNPRATSRKSARGLMQLMPGTAARFGVTNPFDPQQNIEAGTKYLKELLHLYNGNLPLTLAAYNAGPDRVQLFHSVPPYRETRDYVRRVTERLQQNSKFSASILSH